MRARRIYYVLPSFALRDGSDWTTPDTRREVGDADHYAPRDHDRHKVRALGKRARRAVRHLLTLPLVKDAA